MSEGNLRTSIDEVSCRSPEEFEAAVAALDVVQHLRLRRIAQALQGGAGMPADDLLQESYLRARSGSRRWPVDVDVVRFLAGVMESLADAARDSTRTARSITPVINGEMTPANSEGIANAKGVLVELRPRVPSPEEELIRAEEEGAEREKLRLWRQELLDLFADDYKAQLLVEGMMEGYKGEELRELAELSREEFPTKYKKVHRRIIALKAGRGQS